MRAVIITRPGGPDVLELRDVPPPTPDSTEVLVRVRASALNRADLLQREGRYPPPPDAPADIPGIEFAGEVDAVGARVQLWRPGQRVYGIAGGGAHAELLVAHERAVAEVPAGLEWVEAGAVPEAFITAHDALVTQASVRPGERVLVHAAGSGVGLAAIQLVRALGAIPFGTARTADKVERAREYGLEDGAALPDGVDPLAQHVQRWTGGRGVDVVLDLVGGPYVEPSVAALAPRGRLVLIGTVAGRTASLPLHLALSRRLTIRGTVLRARPLEEKIAATRLFAAEVGPLLARRAVRPVLDSHFPLAEVRAAHERLESNATFGKVGLAL
ncbi:MAG TPA: NAD(P)H-quinone oxidoreductase [Gemmatimonadaceae bacterium]|nr:NAD(P)H-quinone oxidoreductase [Gemmatimonadaceae bacterium]